MTRGHFAELSQQNQGFGQLASGQLASAEAKLGARAERGAVRGGVAECRERPRSRASESEEGPATGPPVA